MKKIIGICIVVSVVISSCRPDTEEVYEQTPYVLNIPKPFPKPTLPEDNPLTVEGIALGKKLFFDNKLSKNNLQSCASCHALSNGFTDNGLAVSTGVDGISGTRNSMPLFNLFWDKDFFWDGRRQRLKDQVLDPIQDPIEMHETLEAVIEKLKGDSDYPLLFKQAFNQGIDANTMSMALEQFLLSIVSLGSKFDRALIDLASKGAPANFQTLGFYLTPEERHGFELILKDFQIPSPGSTVSAAGDCFHCHNSPFFRISDFTNNGLDSIFADAGRAKVTGDYQNDIGKFKVPTLRNAALTAPYMHDGRFKTLEEVVDHYNSGGIKSRTLDPNMRSHDYGGLNLSESDKKDLIAFINSLTDTVFINNPAYMKD